MIERIFTEPELPERGIEAQKIRALFQAYGTGYDFCKFYKQDKTVLAYLDGSCVLFCDNNSNFSELSDFLQITGFSDLFCSLDVVDMLSKYIHADYHKVFSMKFTGNTSMADIRETDSLSDLFNIVSSGFDIEFEPWYLDMSHRIRHGVTRAFQLDEKAALVVQHNINGEALLSQIAVVPNFRGNGYASKLIKAVCSALSPSECYVICEPKLIPFYENVGFAPSGKYCIVSPFKTDK